MSDPFEVHRKEVTQRVQLAHIQGGWEGTHTDFKKELDSNPTSYAKLLKHILAFANTPRRTDAYIIYGVKEDKNLRTFSHDGVNSGKFPTPETIENLIRQYTKVSGVVVDAHFSLGGKITPYVMIPLQYEGPHSVLRAIHGAPDVLASGEIVCRYGSSSIRATERDELRMKSDWASWFLDCRYEKNPKTLVDLLAKRFRNHTVLNDEGGYVRMVYDSAINDEFGTNVAPILVHAYAGFDSVEPDAVDRIVADRERAAFGRTLIGARFSLAAKATAARVGVRCVPLDEIYFVADPYAKLCRAFLERWEKERSSQHLHFIVDLDYKRSASTDPDTVHRSILTFLEKQLSTSERVALVVHGDFGCGKTTTARQLVAELCGEYLRGNVSVPKLIYVDVNNIDIRAKRDDCIKAELSKYRLPHEVIDGLLTQIREDEVHLAFDGVDEMARPYTAEGRAETIGFLSEVGNRRAAIYLVRSAYFPKLTEMIAAIGSLADHDFTTARKRTVLAKIVRLRQEQVNQFLDVRLGLEDAKAVRSSLTEARLESFLEDPLIISFVAQLVETHGRNSLGVLPHKGKRAAFLSHLVEQLLKREQIKRSRHRGLDFEQFQRLLRSVAFSMVSRGATTIEPAQLEAFVGRATDSGLQPDEAVNAFRTMSWIHRSDSGSLSFRHEALTIVCAAEHICAALESHDVISLDDWQSGAPLAAVVCDCAAEAIKSSELLGATALMGAELPFNVRTLVSTILELANQRDGFGIVPDAQQFDGKKLADICRGIVAAPGLSNRAIEILFMSIGEKRSMQVTLPLLWLMARRDSAGRVAAAVTILGSKIRPKFDLNDELKTVKDDLTSFVDSVLLKELKIRTSDLLDLEQYESLFKKMEMDTSIDGHAVQYADRTLRSIEGEKQRREEQFRRHASN